MSSSIVYIGPPGYFGPIKYAPCNECKGKHATHGTVRKPCQTCNGEGIVAVPHSRGDGIVATARKSIED